MNNDLFNYRRSANGMWVPSRYPGRTGDNTDLPTTIGTDFNRLKSHIEQKYSKEYVKVCAYYNKLFRTLKGATNWDQSSHNAVPFTTLNQESNDVGTGINANYLKQVIDTVVSRIGNISFDINLEPEAPSLMFEISKDIVTRYLRAFVRKERLNRKCTEVFHDAAVLSFGHLFIDPWANRIRRVSDWELGYYEAEFNENNLQRVMIRDFQFPVSELGPYITGLSQEKLRDVVRGAASVDLQLYIDCFRQEKWAVLDATPTPATPYKHDRVYLSTFSWDLGIKRGTVTSLFDRLWPIQRTINKLQAKETQLIANYKGPVPVIPNDCDPQLKNIGPAAGEVLILGATNRMDPAKVITTINPTPLDPNIATTITSYKQTMYELAGIQQGTLDIENYRSAAAIVALDQIRDQNFQTQLSGMSDFIKEITLNVITYRATETPEEEIGGGVKWTDLQKMVEKAFAAVIPRHVNALNGNTPIEIVAPSDQIVNEFVLAIVQGTKDFNDLNVIVDYERLKVAAALKLESIEATGEDESEEYKKRLLDFLIQCFVKDLKEGTFPLSSISQQGPAPEAAPEEQPPAE